MTMKGRNLLSVPDFMVTLLAIKQKPGQMLTQLHLTTLITYSHLHLIVKTMIDEGWVTTLKDGRTIKVYTTEKGQTIAELIEKTFTQMGINVYDLKELKIKKNGENVLWTREQLGEQ